MRPMSEAAIAYVAAMIDAEGVISIARHKGGARERKANREPAYRPIVIVTNSHAGLIGFLAQVTGEGTLYQNHKPPRDNWLPIHRWQCMAASARRLLSTITPYLVVKRNIAELVLQLQPIPKTSTFEERLPLRTKQIDLYEQVKALNKRGSGSHKSHYSLSDFPADHPLIRQ